MIATFGFEDFECQHQDKKDNNKKVMKKGFKQLEGVSNFKKKVRRKKEPR